MDYWGIMMGFLRDVLEHTGFLWDLHGYTTGVKKNTWNHLLDGWRLARANRNVNMKRWDLTWQERGLWEKKHKTWVIV